MRVSGRLLYRLPNYRNMANKRQKADKSQSPSAFSVRSTKVDQTRKPDLDKVNSVVLSDRQRSRKEALYLVIRSRNTGEIKFDSISIKSYRKSGGKLVEKPEHSVTLSSEITDEIQTFIDFAIAARSGAIPDESGEFVVVGAPDAISKETLVRFLSDLSASGKIDTLADVLGEIKYDGDLLKALLDRAAQDPKLFAEAAAALNLVSYKQAFNELKALVNKPKVKEQEFQTLLKDNPWMFGSEYSELLPNRKLTRDEEQDFILRRTTDGYIEVVEIKTPLEGKDLFRHDSSHDCYYAGADLSKVIGQVQNYLDLIDADRDKIRIRDSEDPFKTRAKIIVGRSGDENQTAALRSLNGHLMRIEVITFDQLISIAKRTLMYLYTSLRPANQAI